MKKSKFSNKAAAILLSIFAGVAALTESPRSAMAQDTQENTQQLTAPRQTSLESLTAQALKAVENNDDIFFMNDGLDFKKIMKHSSEEPVYVMFFHPECVWCNNLKPYLVNVFEKHQGENKGILVLVDVANPRNADIAGEYAPDRAHNKRTDKIVINGVPQFSAYVGGKFIAPLIGMPPDTIDEKAYREQGKIVVLSDAMESQLMDYFGMIQDDFQRLKKQQATSPETMLGKRKPAF